MFINIFYWIGAALPPQDHWDLSRFSVTHIEIRGGHPPNSSITRENPSYTEALWRAIALTKSKDWLVSTGWTPKTEAWSNWLHEAETAALDEPIMKKEVAGVPVWIISSWDFKKALSYHLQSKSELYKNRKMEV